MKVNNLIIAGLTASMFFYGCGAGGEKKQEDTQEVASTEVANNTLTQEELNDGWKLLFDGETSNGWRGYNSQSFPSDWRVEDGALYMAASGRGEAGSENGGDILYDQQFGNFHLKLEWRISPNGNAGIFYLGQESDELDYIWKTAPEMQVLDNQGHPDANMGTNGNRQAGSLYDLYAATPQNAKPVGEWNQVEIIHNNRNVKHIQNGVVVVEYTIGTEKWEADVAASKFPALNPNWSKVAERGYIGLQDHGDDVWFRNIKIKELE